MQIKYDHEGVQHFQDKWAMHLPWAKFVVKHKGDVHHVHCGICLRKKGRKSFLRQISIIC
jgi:hypothetical protein